MSTEEIAMGDELAAESDTAHQGDRRLGSVLAGFGKLSEADIERVLRLQRDRRLRFGEAALELNLISPSELEQALANQFGFSYLIPGKSRVSTEIVAAYEAIGERSEAVRALRSDLLTYWLNGEARNRSLAIVSPGRGEGRSYLAANMAVAFAQLGERTLLIDADLRNPRQHQLFGLDNKAGLSMMLSGRPSAAAFLQIPDLPTLSVLPAGSLPPNPQELFSRPQFVDLVRAVADDYSVIIIDTPAAGRFAETLPIAMSAGATLLALHKDTSRVADARALLGRFKRAGVHFVGTTMTAF